MTAKEHDRGPLQPVAIQPRLNPHPKGKRRKLFARFLACYTDTI